MFARVPDIFALVTIFRKMARIQVVAVRLLTSVQNLGFHSKIVRLICFNFNLSLFLWKTI